MKLKVTGASKSFEVKLVFQEVDLWVETGEVVGLFGRNGSGKSTLLKMMFGVLAADALELQIGEERVPASEVIKRQCMGYLPQERFLPNRMTVRNIIAMCHKEEEVLDKICYAPGIFKMEQLRYGELSEGQKKYLEILLVAHLKHPFLLLDEPFSMIDPKYKDLIKELLLSLKKSKGILITDHYYQDVLQLAERGYLMKEGKIQDVQSEGELRELGYLSSRS